jgi:hypothetical protein
VRRVRERGRVREERVLDSKGSEQNRNKKMISIVKSDDDGGGYLHWF